MQPDRKSRMNISINRHFEPIPSLRARIILSWVMSENLLYDKED
ncbi:hypothetical protein AVDCRST_MAG92-1772 [uncultured Coleofasciculus sp.]|uniref:Uncharacterized protein n=1 Tax=uncultured Coleofasciculus sp. TaxID=1267456 RepID=A0A6J4IBR3_9CYAN|nr:hypothetical protein AVDCRST_MAG92-1772 [uncultured Coleofasciculus sp.]